jgi:hypothetical protein
MAADFDSWTRKSAYRYSFSYLTAERLGISEFYAARGQQELQHVSLIVHTTSIITGSWAQKLGSNRL